ncbi:MAG: RDD family protein [Anaerolineae bacterium]
MDLYTQYLSPSQWMRYAGFWRRFLAAIVDTVMLIFIYFAAGLLVVVFLVGVPARQWMALLDGTGPFIAAALVLLIAWVYSAAFECSAGQGTIGKSTLGMAVCDEGGQRISFWRASLRFLGKVLICLTLGVGFVIIAFDRRRRGLDDRLARTVVIEHDIFGRDVVRGSRRGGQDGRPERDMPPQWLETAKESV